MKESTSQGFSLAKFPEISGNPYKSRKFPEISGNFRKSIQISEISGNFRKFPEISGNFRKFLKAKINHIYSKIKFKNIKLRSKLVVFKIEGIWMIFFDTQLLAIKVKRSLLANLYKNVMTCNKFSENTFFYEKKSFVIVFFNFRKPPILTGSNFSLQKFSTLCV